MPVQTTSEILAESFQDLWAGVITFIPELVIALVIFIVGWIVGVLLGRIIDQIIKAVKLDSALRSAGLEAALNRGGINLNSGRFIGQLVKWFFIVVFLVAALDVLGLEQVNLFLHQVVLLYLPQVIVAALILLVAVVIAEVMHNVVSSSAKAAHMNARSAKFVGSLTKWSIWVFAGLAALYQLGVAAAFIQTLFTGIVVALALAFGLAFGLGGKDAARDALEHVRSEIKKG